MTKNPSTDTLPDVPDEMPPSTDLFPMYLIFRMLWLLTQSRHMNTEAAHFVSYILFTPSCKVNSRNEAILGRQVYHVKAGEHAEVI